LSGAALPTPVLSLIAAAIDSVAQLEIVLLLRREPGREWTAGQVAAELRTEAGWTGDQLESLRSRGLAARGTAASGRLYRYSATGDLAERVDALATAYAAFPVAVITAIYSRPSATVRQFADAFRLRRPAGGGPGGAGGGPGTGESRGGGGGSGG
jgi:hypothetical protein